MKKQVCWLMAVVMLISCFAFPAFAVAPQEENATPAPQVGDPIYLVDGTTITIGPIKKIETRGYIMYLERPITVGDGYEEYCRFTLIARFLVNDNNTITCISSLYDISISDDHWSIENPKSSCSDHGTYSVATATATAKKRLLGIVTRTVPLTATITAHSDGSYE